MGVVIGLINPIANSLEKAIELGNCIEQLPEGTFTPYHFQKVEVL